MKRYLLLATLLFALMGCSSEQRDLYKMVDHFVEELDVTYQSYGLTGVAQPQYTPNRTYQITPIGRLINVRIETTEADNEDYEKLKDKLSKHFKNDSRVNNVYICQGGTVMIDCRN